MIFIYFFKYETIETHARASLALIISALGSVIYHVLFTNRSSIQHRPYMWWIYHKWESSPFSRTLFLHWRSKKLDCIFRHHIQIYKNNGKILTSFEIEKVSLEVDHPTLVVCTMMNSRGQHSFWFLCSVYYRLGCLKS